MTSRLRGKNEERAVTEGGSASDRDIQKTRVGRSKMTVVAGETGGPKNTEEPGHLDNDKQVTQSCTESSNESATSGGNACEI